MQPTIGFDSPALRDAHQAEQDARHARIVTALQAAGYTVIHAATMPRYIIIRR